MIPAKQRTNASKFVIFLDCSSFFPFVGVILFFLCSINHSIKGSSLFRKTPQNVYLLSLSVSYKSWLFEVLVGSFWCDLSAALLLSSLSHSIKVRCYKLLCWFWYLTYVIYLSLTTKIEFGKFKRCSNSCSKAYTTYI